MKKLRRNISQKMIAGTVCLIITVASAVGYCWGSKQLAGAEELVDVAEEATTEMEECTDIVEEATAETEESADMEKEAATEAEESADMEEEATTETEECTDIVEGTDAEVEEFTDMAEEATAETGEITEIIPEPTTASYTTIEQYCIRLYEVCLGRTPDETGLEYWTGRLRNQEVKASDVAYSFVFSEECKARNLSDDEFIDMLYNALLNRSAASSEKELNTRHLQQGLSREYLLQDITYKMSFYTMCENCGMLAGAKTGLTQPRDQNPELTRFVNRLYTEALGRNGEEGGLNYWCESLINGTRSPYTVAEFFINSPEFKGMNLSDEEYVKTLYRTFFGREYDLEGLNFWMGRLATGTSREYVLHYFEYSCEFFEIVKYFNIRSEAELWVDERNLILNNIANPTAKAAILYALDRVGYPYSQELRNTGAYYDCSSLVYYSWQYAGVNISYRGSNTAAAQAQGLVEAGKQIHPASVREMQPGDLIFDTGSNNGRYMGIFHVAMYMGFDRVIETPVNGVVGRTYVDDNILRERVESGSWIICRP